MLRLILFIFPIFLVQYSFAIVEMTDRELDDPSLHCTEEMKRFVNTHNIVFVGGIFNEVTRNYFTDNVESIKEICPEASLHKLFPSSLRSVEENSELLDVDFNQIFKANKKPLLVVAHSKGAAETINLLFSKPELMSSNIISKFVMVNGSMGGSYLADAFANPRLIIDKFNWDPNFEFPDITAGILSTQTSVSDNRVKKGLRGLNDDEYVVLKNNIFYVRCSIEMSLLPLKFKPGQILINMLAQNPASDGILTLNDQIIEGFGEDLGTFSYDHSSLIAPSGNSDVAFRKAFTRSLIQEISTR